MFNFQLGFPFYRETCYTHPKVVTKTCLHTVKIADIICTPTAYDVVWRENNEK